MASYNLIKNRVTIAGKNEVIRQSLYDYQLYPTAGLTSASFFQVPVGQGQSTQNGAVVGQPKTLGDTDIRSAGTLPAGNMFRIESIEVPFFAGSTSTASLWVPQIMTAFNAVAAATVGKASDDVNVFYSGGHLQLFILSKPYLDEAPLGRFPPKTHTEVRTAMATNSATTSEVINTFAYQSGRPYIMKPEITLTPTMNFQVTIDWLAAIATPSGFNARFGVVLDGLLERSAQ